VLRVHRSCLSMSRERRTETSGPGAQFLRFHGPNQHLTIASRQNKTTRAHSHHHAKSAGIRSALPFLSTVLLQQHAPAALIALFAYSVPSWTSPNRILLPSGHPSCKAACLGYGRGWSRLRRPPLKLVNLCSTSHKSHPADMLPTLMPDLKRSDRPAAAKL